MSNKSIIDKIKRLSELSNNMFVFDYSEIRQLLEHIENQDKCIDDLQKHNDELYKWLSKGKGRLQELQVKWRTSALNLNEAEELLSLLLGKMESSNE